MKKDGEEVLQGASLSMEKLHIKIVGSPIEGMQLATEIQSILLNNNNYLVGAHRALPDVLALERVFTHSALAGSLANLSVRTPQVQLSLWINQRNTYRRAAALIKSLGRPNLTSTQAKNLDSLGIGYTELLQLREYSGTAEVFLTYRSEGQGDTEQAPEGEACQGHRHPLNLHSLFYFIIYPAEPLHSQKIPSCWFQLL